MVFLRDGFAVLAADAPRRSITTLPCGDFKLLWPGPCAHPAFQRGPHLAPATCDLLGLHLVSCCRHFPGSDDYRERAARAVYAGVHTARRPGFGGCGEPGR